jgi:hypothetical protein
MTKDNRSEDTPNPVSTNICDSFEAELGAEVTFTNATAGAEIKKVQPSDTWPFVKGDGTSFGPPIGPFPLPGAQHVYIDSSLTVGQSYQYDVTQSCPSAVTKNVKIIASMRLQRSA